MSSYPPWSREHDICNFGLLSGEDLCLQELALNAVLELKIKSTSLFTLLPRHLCFVNKCGIILDVLHKGEFFKLNSFHDNYEETWKDSNIVMQMPPVELALRRNLLRNTYGLTECVLTNPDFLIQFKHFTSLAICKTRKTLPCCGRDGEYENQFDNDNFFSYIKTVNRSGFQTIRRLIDFVSFADEVIVRIQYCLTEETPLRKKHYHFNLTFEKIKGSEKINVDERTSKSLGSIQLFEDLTCPQDALGDITLSEIF